MRRFNYSLFAKLFYRYANIPASILLIFYTIPSLAEIYQNRLYAIPVLINILIFVLLNRFYIKSYRTFPFSIEADNEKMICTDYFFSDKKIEVRYENIENITGGLFSGNTSRPLYIHYSPTNEVIGIHAHLKNYDKLVTIILSNVKQHLYNEILEKTKALRTDNKSKRDKKKSGVTGL
ncbi:MAG: hypothetical protein JW995_02540 [Melioribacteraceae bacterium]|nr:hypothetical protein [Melioribacteraceae bacterium]